MHGAAAARTCDLLVAPPGEELPSLDHDVPLLPVHEVRVAQGPRALHHVDVRAHEREDLLPGVEGLRLKNGRLHARRGGGAVADLQREVHELASREERAFAGEKVQRRDRVLHAAHDGRVLLVGQDHVLDAHDGRELLPSLLRLDYVDVHFIPVIVGVIAAGT